MIDYTYCRDVLVVSLLNTQKSMRKTEETCCQLSNTLQIISEHGHSLPQKCTSHRHTATPPHHHTTTPPSNILYNATPEATEFGYWVRETLRKALFGKVVRAFVLRRRSANAPHRSRCVWELTEVECAIKVSSWSKIRSPCGFEIYFYCFTVLQRWRAI